VKQPRRLPSAREYMLLTWDARLEVLAALQSLRLEYLKTERIPVTNNEPQGSKHE
jgi:hypothetical protein